MNILIVSQYYYPEQFLLNEIAPELVKHGHSVTVLTGLPNYPKGRIYKQYRFFRNRKQVIKGVNIIRCFEIGRRNSTFFLALNYLSYAISATFKALFLKDKFDVVFCYEVSPITVGIPAIIIKKKNNIKLLLYCCDLFPESVKSHIKSEDSIFYKMIARLSKYIYNQCDHIAVSSKPFIDYLSNINSVDKSRMSYLPQHADDLYLDMDMSVPDKDCIDFLFAGNIGYAQNIETIIEATEIIKGVPNFMIHIVGDGSRLSYLKEMVKLKKLNNKFIFHGRYPAKDMHKFYKMADVLLITLRSNNFVGMTMPSKLQTYMTVGKPIIGSINGAAQQVIAESQCGICVNAGDSTALADAMKNFIENSYKYEKCGNNARKYFIEHFTKEKYIRELEKELNKLIRE